MSRIVVAGAGGGGIAALGRLVGPGADGMLAVAVDSDPSVLDRCAAVRIDAGAGSRARLAEVLAGADVAIVLAGLGGGTGARAASLIVGLARSEGALTIAVVTRPFRFEGRARNAAALTGLDALRDAADAVVVVANDRLAEVVDRKTTLAEAYRVAADVLRQGALAIAGPLARPGALALDLPGLRAVLAGRGEALLGLGAGAVVDAARQAVASPLLEGSLPDARSILVSIAAGRLVRRAECEAAVAAVRLAAGPGPAIVAGAAVDERVGAEARVAIVATRGRLPEPPSPGVAEPAPPPRPRSLDDMFVLARPRPRRPR